MNLAELIGDKLPTFRKTPAVWWITTDQAQLDAYARFEADYDASHRKIMDMAESLGCESAATSGFADQTSLLGFHPPRAMQGDWYFKGERVPVPEHWRIDSKSHLLVPSRRTKADRESQANKDFQEIHKIPNVNSYVTGLPSDILNEDRDFGGTAYAVNYRRGEHCLMAFSGGNPDEQSWRGQPKVDTDIWQRQKLSDLLILIEERNGQV